MCFQDKYLPLIRQDNVPEFALLYGMNGTDHPLDMFDDILMYNADGIRDWLLDEREDFIEEYPPEELLFFGVSKHGDDEAVRLIDAIEARWPGTAKNCRDCFGSNLLWYSCLNPNRGLTRSSSRDNILFQRLQTAGCNMTEVNLFGLAPLDILRTVQMKRKDDK